MIFVVCLSSIYGLWYFQTFPILNRARHYRGRMGAGYTTTLAISASHHELRLWRGVLDTTLCDEACQ